MRKLVASALYVSLAAGLLAQQPNGEGAAERDAFHAQSRLVNSYRNSGDYRSAERVLREWLASEPAGSLSRAKVQNGLASLLQEEGRTAEARKLFVEVVNWQGVTWRQRLSAVMGLADADVHQGALEKGIVEWNAALEIARGNGDTVSEAAVLRGLGYAWLSGGSAARAEPLLRGSLRMIENAPAAAPLEVAASLTAMGEYYRAEDKLALAEDAWSRAVAIEQTAFGDCHPQVAILLELLADVYSERGERDLAQDYATRAADSMRQWFGDGAPPAATALANLAMVEQRAHTLSVSASHYEAAVRILRGFPELRPTLRIVLQRYAGVLKALHRDQEAKVLDTEVKAFRFN